MAQAVTLQTISLVLLTGFIPPLLWLWFWLKEDPHPEPKKALLKSFLLGALIVPIVLLAEYTWYFLALYFGFANSFNQHSLWLLAPWAFIEELAKFSVAWFADLRRSVYDEPVDAVIYLITVALGFAAMENVLFLLKILSGSEGFLAILMTADLRFIGAVLLHIVTSGVIGVSIAFSFFHPERHMRNIWGGIALATILHTAFNKFIINSGSSADVFQTFFMVWTLALILIFFFEKVKKINP
jgi:RsiW-degrading membrane proteinase PrsW (M82 family)